jgi:amino acid transporter
LFHFIPLTVFLLSPPPSLPPSLLRSIYAEGVSSLPLNGGSYNILLNATTKGLAALCACLSLLSYLATGVVSAISAMAYLQDVYPSLPLDLGATLLLFLFACLVTLGVKEGGRVATCLYILHMTVLTLLLLLGAAYASQHTHIFMDNLNAPFPDITIVNTRQRGTVRQALPPSLPPSLLLPFNVFSYQLSLPPSLPPSLRSSPPSSTATHRQCWA